MTDKQWESIQSAAGTVLLWALGLSVTAVVVTVAAWLCNWLVKHW